MRTTPPPCPAVSLVIATCRLGGLDITWEMLRAQTERDFEVILVDYWWEERKDIVAERWHETGLSPDRLTHVPPRKGRWFGAHDSGQAYNTGFALARAPLVCIGGDYWYAHPRYIEQHLAVFRRSWSTPFIFQGHIFHTISLTGHHCKRHPTALRVPYNAQESLFSTFANEFVAKRDLFEMWTTILCMRTVGECPPDWPWRGLFPVRFDFFNATQNDSLPRSVLYRINGFDERYSGGVGHADLDLGLRSTISGNLLVMPEDCGIAWDVDQYRLPPEVATKMFTARQSEAVQKARNIALYARRIEAIQAGDALFAPNDGFRLDAPLSPADVIASYEAHRP